MTDRDIDLPPPSDDRSNLNKRVSDDVQRRFGEFVDKYLPNRKGAYGYAVEKAMEEFMDRDRYARIEDEVSDLRSTAAETNAMVRRIITAEKEKGAFLEPAPRGNQAGDRRERENAVISELARRVAVGEHKPEFSESELNAIIVEVADVGSEPTKRDYRESMMDRGMLEPTYGKYRVTEDALSLGGFAVAGGESA